MILARVHSHCYWEARVRSQASFKHSKTVSIVVMLAICKFSDAFAVRVLFISECCRSVHRSRSRVRLRCVVVIATLQSLTRRCFVHARLCPCVLISCANKYLFVSSFVCPRNASVSTRMKLNLQRQTSTRELTPSRVHISSRSCFIIVDVCEKRVTSMIRRLVCACGIEIRQQHIAIRFNSA